MAEAATKSESMENILQSIKRIIEDDSGTDAKPAETPASGDGVLELTQVIKEDGSVASLSPLPAVKPEPQPQAVAPVAPPSIAHEPKVIPLDEGLVSDQAAQAAMKALRPIMESSQKDYSIPHIPSSSMRNGNTVEDLVLEALKPMLKAWLDEHLPLIVQKIVEKEVKRLVTFHNN